MSHCCALQYKIRINPNNIPPVSKSERHCLRRYWQVLTIIQSRRIYNEELRFEGKWRREDKQPVALGK